MSRYDTRTTTFSQEGRLFQVEYALEAINNASSTMGIVTKEGVVLAADRLVSTKLLDPGLSKEKIYVVDEHIAVAVAGWTADANVLLNDARLTAQRHRYRFDEPVSLESLVTHLCDIKQSYTQFGGLRPFGVSFLFAGYTPSFGQTDTNCSNTASEYAEFPFQLILTDPAGNFSGWKATAVGQNSVTAQSILKQEWRDDLTLQEGLELAAKILTQITDAGNQTLEQTEFAILYIKDGQVKQRFLSQNEVSELLKKAAASAKIVIKD
ncbi:proteasome subunit alpha type [Gregarina niphandrodes]|uniref:Proteasome subunit alpha type n=1 Tax=Gregarina niphandrodes TaxID=110365 RepID=A0A023AZP4_GRENI|nr:proteasome subunit alpha type [Gregarina niphandrodes]EZG44281.1 proteasome subunit alpha type [Gregarina niphandrodes]|eukprot:XP_011132732.1 proteasome subunit alpha type [Gregarina niphandrodes]